MGNIHFDEIIRRYSGKKSGNQYIIRCPAEGHDDKNPSCLVSVSDKHPNPNLKCMAGCSWEEITSALKKQNLWVNSRQSQKEGFQKLWEKGIQISPNSPQGIYLASRNCFVPLSKEQARAIPSLKHPSGNYYPAILTPFSDSYGKLTGLQRLYITKDGKKAPEENIKLSLGKIKGSSVKLGNEIHNGTINICEGFETAMSIYKMTGNRTLAVGAADNIKEQGLFPFITRVLIWADIEKSQVGMEEAYKALEIFKSEFRDVGIMIPKEAPYV